ncbi:MAG: ComEC/Rec2 family competence protein, partial [Clostridia bacterium]
MKKRERLFNNRPVCFCAFAMAIGILLGEGFSFINPLFRLVPLLLFGCIILTFLLRKNLRKFAYLIIAVAVGFIAISAENDIYKSKMVDKLTGEFQATVASDIVVDDDTTKFYVEDIICDGVKYDGRSLLQFKFEIEPTFGAGDKILFKGTLISNQHLPFDSFYASNACHNQYYKCYGYYLRKLADDEMNFPLNIQMKIKQMLYENTDETTASICQALLIGDKFGIEAQLNNEIKATGVAHLLAVSGLHVSALAGALYFLLKKLKVKPKARFVVVTILTFIYVMLCSFSPSALRAFIMSSVFTLSGVFGKKQDNLSSLGLAAVILLFIRPTSLMNVGFLLSIFAVLGIMLLYKPFNDAGGRVLDKISNLHFGNKISNKNNINNKNCINDSNNINDKNRNTTYGKKIGWARKFGNSIVSSGSLSLASNISTYPFIAYFFGVVPTYFLIANLIILPYMMCCYLFLLVLAVFALVTSLGSVFVVMDYLLMPFKWLVKFFTALPLSTIDVAIGYIGIITFVICMILSTRFVFLSRRKRLIAILLTAACG